MIAKFASWSPKGLMVPKAILVLTPPSQSDGRFMVKDVLWQSFAMKHGLILIGCFFQDDHPTWIEQYADAHESGAALLRYVLNIWSNPPPFLLWGFSAGGQFNYEFAVQHPLWVAGFVVNKGGIYYTALAPERTRTIKGLWIHGELDSKWRQDIVRGIYSLNHEAGAHWELVSERCGHSVCQSEIIGMDFFERVLKEMK